MIAPPLALATRWRIEGQEHLPRQGGVLVASNHVSYADPIAVTLFALAGGRVPRFFAKAGLWSVPVVRSVMASGRHIQVHRGRASALRAYRDAVRAVGEGDCVVVFPEGTFTDRADGWPIEGKTGLARMALTSGVPVVPLACWGTRELLPVESRLPRVLPRPTLHLVAGPPVDLSDLAGERPSATQLREATERIMAAITELLAEVRGLRPPDDAARA
ncbi:lysophospholipid acyltransferase family protein [Saccharomonospora saliphila]|uniref:lysophospholipid acyltransferase family protein n=1 Tax=Saccharomonospora saliphila TaxID=369829 RepID=UPI000371D202|nr:lysophospholipid acyltransferase family protein [Saccharomonospora saliphila]